MDFLRHLRINGFSEPEILGSFECSQILSRIGTQPALLIKRTNNLATIGRPSYMYRGNVPGIEELNNRDVLSVINEFDWNNILYLLHKQTNLHFVIDFQLRIPGVHIFSANEGDVFPGGVFHRDIFHHTYPFLTSGVEMLSITIPLHVPSGSGLDIKLWPQGLGATFIPYRPGTAVIFFADIEHRVSPFAAIGGDAKRVSLQCHAFERDGAWTLFW